MSANPTTIKDLQAAIANSYLQAAQKVYGKGRVSLSQSANEVVISGNQQAAIIQSIAQSERKPVNLYEGTRQWIEESGTAYKKIPYVRKESEKWKPKFTPEQRGQMSLAGKITHKIKEEGVTLAQAQQTDAAFAAESIKINQQAQTQLGEIIRNMIKP